MSDGDVHRSSPALRALAADAGIAPTWYDYRGEHRTVGEATLRALLAALDLPCARDDEIARSRARLAAETGAAPSDLPPLITAPVGAPIVLPTGDRYAGSPYRIVFDGAASQGGAAAGRVPDEATEREATADAGDADGRPGRVRDGRFADDGASVVDPIDDYGYHRLEIDGRTVTLAVAPPRCFGVAEALGDAGRAGHDARPWGLAAQIYSLAQEHDGGLGHYGALAELVRRAAAHGASALAISPVHAMFSADLHRYSPYGPSSRLLANALHVDPRLVLGDAAFDEAVEALGVAESLDDLGTAPLVDWPASSTVRLSLLRWLYDRMTAQDDRRGAALRDALAAFRAAGGDVLESHARFEALHAMLAADDPAMLGGWRSWPDEYRDPHGDAVTRFADAHRDDVGFHAFLQWQASVQLAAAQRAARDAGMPIGIVADLAVGADGSGSQTWSHQDDMLIGLSIGAPPDLLNGAGQSWGLAAFSPRALRRSGFRPWIDMLRAAFAHAGGIRIDHVLGLTRMWLVPEGAAAIDGAYLRYPFDDLLRLVALESWRHRAIVIGEDLGTVPEGLPERLSAAGLLGIRVLWFERRWNDAGQPFKAPHEWSDGAQAVTTTHDLPTTAGWWHGRDIDWRARLGLLGEGVDDAGERRTRDSERDLLWRAMCDAGVATGARPPADAVPIVEALRFVGVTPAPLAIAPLEDALAIVEQPNLPGTIDSHPNWRLRMPAPVETLLDDPAVGARLTAFAEGRRRR